MHDYTSYLLKVIENIVEDEQFNMNIYELYYPFNQLPKDPTNIYGPHTQLHTHNLRKSQLPTHNKQIRISVFDSLDNRFYHFNVMKDSMTLTLKLKIKALASTSLTLIFLPYILITIGKKSYSMLMRSALHIYTFYNFLNVQNNRSLWNFQLEILTVINKIIATIVLIFFALIGLENAITIMFMHEAVDMVFIISILEIFYSVVIRSEIGKRWFPRFVYLVLGFCLYHMNYYSHTSNKLLIYTTYLIIDYLMLFFFHHFELPLIDSLREDFRDINFD